MAGLDRCLAVGVRRHLALEWGTTSPQSNGCCCSCPADNHKGKSEEMDQPSSLADEKGRNVTNCNAFIKAFIGMQRANLPSSETTWPQTLPQSVVEITQPSHTHTHKSTVPAMCYLMFHGRADLSSWGSGIIPKGYGAFSFGLVGNRSSYTK